MAELKFPSEIIDLPSKGILYPEGHPLKEGKVEMKYMTAKEEDILSNQSYINKNIVLDKLLESMIISPKIDIKDLIIGDKNALLIAARILGYGSKYTFTVGDKQTTVDLKTLDSKPLRTDLITEGKNEIEFVLPQSENKITFKFLTGHDEKKIDAELEGFKKINKDVSPELTTRLKYMITSVEGNTDENAIRNFVDNYLLAMDSRALRDFYKEVMPDVDMSYEGEDGRFRNVSIGLTFFWPDLENSRLLS